MTLVITGEDYYHFTGKFHAVAAVSMRVIMNYLDGHHP